MTQYYSYFKDNVPEALLAKYPNCAKYENGDIFLFGESLEMVTGVKDEAVDIDDFTGGIEDEDYMDEQAEKATYTGTKQERIDARRAARKQARIDAKVSLRVRIRTFIRRLSRKQIRFTKRQGQKLYDDWVATLPVQGV